MLRVIAALLTVSLVAGAAEAQVESSRKIALIVAISDYPAGTGYGKLNADRDVLLVASGLMSQGFTENDIFVLRDSVATRNGILGTLSEIERIARGGDAIVFHYSGHGHRITDDNRDELDGLDEVIVPYDAAIVKTAGRLTAYNHIRDDELGVAFERIRRKVGGNGSVTVFLDACYSGSATRGGPGEPAVRGVAEPIIIAGDVRPGQLVSDEAGGALEGPASRGDGADLGTYTVISGARHDQVSNETYDMFRNPVGSLSLALSIALPRARKGETYRALHDRIALAMAGMNLFDQRPQIEGSVDAPLFSGNVVEQTPYYPVAAVLSDSVVRLKGGRLLGLYPGTRVTLYPAGTTDPAARLPLVSGPIFFSDETRADVKVRAPLGRIAANAWAFVTEYTFGDLKLRVRADSGLTPSVRTMTTRALSSLSVVEMAPERPDLIVRWARPSSRGIVVTTPDGTVIGEPIPPQSPAELRSRVLGFARHQMLRRLNLSDPSTRVRLELIRTAPRVRGTGADRTCESSPPVALPNQPRSADGIALKPGDEYTFRLVNEGTTAAYVAILDLTPDGQVRQLFPLEDNLGSDNLLPAGATYVIPDICFYAEPPTGVEVIKLFATKERFDFTPILTGRGTTRSGDASPLEQLFGDVYSGVRSAPLRASGLGTTSSISVTITKSP